MSVVIKNKDLKTAYSLKANVCAANGIIICTGKPVNGFACNKKVKGYKQISWTLDEAAFLTHDGTYRIEVIKLRQATITKRYQFCAFRVFDVEAQAYVTNPALLRTFKPYDFMHS